MGFRHWLRLPFKRATRLGSTDAEMKLSKPPEVPSVKPGIDQNVALLAALTASSPAFLMSALQVLSTSFSASPHRAVNAKRPVFSGERDWDK